MFCSKCGHKLPDDSIFCPECGVSVNEVKSNQQAADQSLPEDRAGSNTRASSTINTATLCQGTKWGTRLMIFFLAGAIFFTAVDFGKFRDRTPGLMVLSRFDRLEVYYNFVGEENIFGFWSGFFFVCLIITGVALIVFEAKLKKIWGIQFKDKIKQYQICQTQTGTMIYSLAFGIATLAWAWALI